MFTCSLIYGVFVHPSTGCVMFICGLIHGGDFASQHRMSYVYCGLINCVLASTGDDPVCLMGRYIPRTNKHVLLTTNSNN